MEARYGFSALEMTTRELFPHLAKIEVAPEMRSDLEKFFPFSDMVKFADADAAPSCMEKDLFFVRDLVLSTRDDPPVPEAGPIRTTIKKRDKQG